MKVNFKKVMVEVSFDNFSEMDVAKELGNFIHANTSDIGLDDVAREIYHSKEDVELEIPEEYAHEISAMVSHKDCRFIAAVKRAIIKELTIKEEYGDK